MSRWGAAIIGFSLASLTCTAATPATAVTGSTTIMTLNVHGSVDRAGSGNAGRPEAIVRDVVALATKYRPRIIALQELCLRQHVAVRARLAKLGYVSTMTYVNRSAGCNDPAGGNQSGVALYLKASKISWRTSAALPWGANGQGSIGRQPRRVLCASGKGWRDIACTTHLSPLDPDRGQQAAVAAAKVTGWAKGRKAAIAGDLNMGRAAAEAAFPRYQAAGYHVDHVLTLGSPALTAAVPVPSSDHPAVVVREESR